MIWHLNRFSDGVLAVLLEFDMISMFLETICTVGEQLLNFIITKLHPLCVWAVYERTSTTSKV